MLMSIMFTSWALVKIFERKEDQVIGKFTKFYNDVF